MKLRRRHLLIGSAAGIGELLITDGLVTAARASDENVTYPRGADRQIAQDVALAIAYGPHGRDTLPLLAAFAELSDQLSRFPTQTDAIDFLRKRAASVGISAASVQRVLNSGLRLDLVVSPPSGVTDRRPFLLSDLACNEHTFDTGTTALGTSGLRNGGKVVVDTLAAAQSSQILVSYLSPADVDPNGKALATAARRALLGPTRVQAVVPGVVDVVFRAVTEFEAVRNGLPEHPSADVLLRAASHVQELTQLVGKAVEWSRTVWGVIQPAPSGAATVSRVDIQTATNGIAGAVTALGALMKLPPDQTAQIASGIQNVGLILGGIATGNPLALIAGLGAVIQSFLGGDSASQQQDAIRSLGDAIGAMDREMRAQFGEMRERLVAIDERLLAVHRDIRQLTKQIELSHVEMVRRTDEILAALDQDARLRTKELWTRLETRIETYSAAFHEWNIENLSRPVRHSSSYLKLKRDDLIETANQLLVNLKPDDTGLGHHIYAGTKTFLEEMIYWNETAVGSPEYLASRAGEVAELLRDPVYGGPRSTTAGPTLIADVLTTILSYVPRIKVSSQTRWRLSLLPGDLDETQFTPRTRAPAGTPGDAWVMGERCARLLRRVPDLTIQESLLVSMVDTLRPHAQMQELLNSANGLEVLTVAHDRLTRETLRLIDVLFCNPLMVAVQRTQQELGLGYPSAYFAMYGTMPTPLGSYFVEWAPGIWHVARRDFDRLASERRSQSQTNLAAEKRRLAEAATNLSMPEGRAAGGRPLRGISGANTTLPTDSLKAFLKPLEDMLVEMAALHVDIQAGVADILKTAADAPFREAGDALVPDLDVSQLGISTKFQGWYSRAVTLVNTRLSSLDKNLDAALRLMTGGEGLQQTCQRLLRAGFGLLVLTKWLEHYLPEDHMLMRGGASPDDELRRTIAPCLAAAIRGAGEPKEDRTFIEAVLPRQKLSLEGYAGQKEDNILLLVGPRDLTHPRYPVFFFGRTHQITVSIPYYTLMIDGNRTDPGLGSPAPEPLWFDELLAWRADVRAAVQGRDVLARGNPAGLALSEFCRRIDGRIRELQISHDVRENIAQSLEGPALQQLLERSVVGWYGGHG